MAASLSCLGNTRIKHWNNDVQGNFNAIASLLESVSAHVKFGGGVYVGETRIKHWQNDVPGGFYAHAALLEVIAPNVRFGGNVDINRTNTARLLAGKTKLESCMLTQEQ